MVINVFEVIQAIHIFSIPHYYYHCKVATKHIKGRGKL